LVAIEVSGDGRLEGEFMQKQEVKDDILRVAGSRFIGGNCMLAALTATEVHHCAQRQRVDGR
jgi:hypothetical protein